MVWCGNDGKDTEIYTWTPAGGTVQITSNGYTDGNPHVSGDRVVWCGMDQENRRDVFTWTPSTGVVQVTHGAYCNGDARVSGDRLAWSVSGEAGVDLAAGVFTWTPESGTVRITSEAGGEGRVMVSGDRLAWSGRPISASDSDGEIFTWTPDGGLVQVTENNVQDETSGRVRRSHRLVGLERGLASRDLHVDAWFRHRADHQQHPAGRLAGGLRRPGGVAGQRRPGLAGLLLDAGHGHRAGDR